MMFGIDVSRFTTDELYGLQDEINRELRRRSEGWSVTVNNVKYIEKSGVEYK
jgi:hypothetical protein